MQIMIKVSDVSNEARPMEVAEPWLDCLLQEFFIQVGLIKMQQGRYFFFFFSINGSGGKKVFNWSAYQKERAGKRGKILAQHHQKGGKINSVQTALKNMNWL